MERDSIIINMLDFAQGHLRKGMGQLQQLFATVIRHKQIAWCYRHLTHKSQKLAHFVVQFRRKEAIVLNSKETQGQVHSTACGSSYIIPDQQ